MTEIESTRNVLVRTRTEVIDAGGDEHLQSITLADRAHDTVQTVPAAALFVMIGGEPHTRWLPDEIVRDPQGYLITGHDLPEPDVQRARPALMLETSMPPALMLETSMPGVFAAGDVRQGSIKRVASAVGEGATVVRMVHEYLRTADHDGRQGEHNAQLVTA